MRSPNVLTGGMGLAEGFAEVLDQFGGRHQIPQQAVGGGLGQFLGGLLVERIGRGHQDRLAHAVERQHAPALAGSSRETRAPGPCRCRSCPAAGSARATCRTSSFKRLVHRQNALVRQHLDERLDDPVRRRWTDPAWTSTDQSRRP